MNLTPTFDPNSNNIYKGLLAKFKAKPDITPGQARAVLVTALLSSMGDPGLTIEIVVATLTAAHDANVDRHIFLEAVMDLQKGRKAKPAPTPGSATQLFEQLFKMTREKVEADFHITPDDETPLN